MLKPFTPVPIQAQSSAAPLLIWYAGDNPLSITESSGSVSVWGDQSGAKNNATQGSGSNQPITGTTTLANKNVIQFNSASVQNLMVPAVIPNLTSGSVTLFLVGKADIDTPGGSNIFWGTDSAQRLYLFQNGSTNFIQASFGPGGPLNIASSVDADVPFIAMVTVNGGTDECALVINNATPLTGSKAFTGAPSTNQLGAFAGTAGPLEGSIAEVIVYGGLLSSSSMTTIFQYLSEKWEIALA